MPAVRMQSATCAGGRSTATPSSSRTSADPVDDDAARLPCLTTVTPAPATTSAAIDEMFTVWARSPPVPQVSTAGPVTSSGAAWLIIEATRPSTSSGVSPLARKAIAKPAICDGVASPLITWSIAQAVCACVRSWRCTRAVSSDGQVGEVVTGSLPLSAKAQWSSEPSSSSAKARRSMCSRGATSASWAPEASSTAAAASTCRTALTSTAAYSGANATPHLGQWAGVPDSTTSTSGNDSPQRPHQAVTLTGSRSVGRRGRGGRDDGSGGGNQPTEQLGGHLSQLDRVDRVG